MREEAQERVGSLKGSLTWWALNHKTGKKSIVLKQGNLVVDMLYKRLPRIFVDTYDKVRYIAWGTNGAAEQVTDTSITLGIRRQVSYEITDDLTVQFSATLENTAGNGESYQEIGLQFWSGTLVSRVTFPSMPKTDLFTWDVTWQLSWSS